MGDDIERRIISLGAGVQSTVMLFMGLEGTFGEPPDAAIFADTGWEPKQVYEHLTWLQGQVDIPIYVVSSGHNLYDDTYSGMNISGRPYTDIPAHVLKADGKTALGKRQCTSRYKIRPIEAKFRELLGRKPRSRSGPKGEQWLGISTDEWFRAKPSGRSYIINRHPLLEQGISRQDCVDWFARVFPGQPLAKSSCVGCPYHSDDLWLRLADQDPEGMDKAIKLDVRLRDPERPQGRISTQYLHRSCRPLSEVLERLRRARAEGQQLSLLNNHGDECSGVCEF